MRRGTLKGLPRRLRPRGWRGLLVAVIAALAVWQWPEFGGYLEGGAPEANRGGPYSLNGRVVAVADGDTVTLLADGQRRRVRLASIDAPETGDGARPGQPYGQAARRRLQALADGAQVAAVCHERDHYDRDVCDVSPAAGGDSFNRRMVAEGMAWANRQGKDKYLRDRGLLRLQDDARQAGRGLWADRGPVSPWVWRHQCWREKQCG